MFMIASFIILSFEYWGTRLMGYLLLSILPLFSIMPMWYYYEFFFFFLLLLFLHDSLFPWIFLICIIILLHAHHIAYCTTPMYSNWIWVQPIMDLFLLLKILYYGYDSYFYSQHISCSWLFSNYFHYFHYTLLFSEPVLNNFLISFWYQRRCYIFCISPFYINFPYF